jgi:hypothetical protein
MTPQEPHQSFLASSTVLKTVRRASAAELMIVGSLGDAVGRALGLRRRLKKELNVCREFSMRIVVMTFAYTGYLFRSGSRSSEVLMEYVSIKLCI